MAEKVMLVCDECGKPAEYTVTLSVAGMKNRQKDLCSDHWAKMSKGSRPTRPGRKAATVPTVRKRAARVKKTVTPVGEG